MINQVKYQNIVDLIENHELRGDIILSSGKLRDLEQVKGNEFFILRNLHPLLMEGNDYSVRRNCCQPGKTHCTQIRGSFPAYKHGVQHPVRGTYLAGPTQNCCL